MRIKGQDNQLYDFPEDASIDEINKFLGTGSKQIDPELEAKRKFLESALGVNSSPMSQLKNVATGLGEAGQNIGDIPMRMAGYNVPKLDIAKTLGAGNTLQDKMEQGIGQMLPAVALGGLGGIAEGATAEMPGLAGVLARTASRGIPQAGYGATQTENPAMGAAMGIGGQLAGETAPIIAQGAQKIPGMISKGYKYLTPNREIEPFMQALGGGQNAEINNQRIAHTVQTAYDTNKADALADKEIVKQSEGENKIYENPKKESEYLTNKNAIKGYGPGLKYAHKEFESNPNFDNADKLQSLLGDEYRDLDAMRKKDNLDPDGRIKLEKIRKAYFDIKDDIDKFMEKRPEESKLMYKSFRDKWKNNVEPYHSDPTLLDITKSRKALGITSNEIRGSFANPSKEIQKVMGDLPEEGKNYLLYNELNQKNPKNANALGQALLDLKQRGGYSQLIKPEHEALAQQLIKRSNYNKAIKKAGKWGAGIGGILTGEEFLRRNL